MRNLYAKYNAIHKTYNILYKYTSKCVKMKLALTDFGA